MRIRSRALAVASLAILATAVVAISAGTASAQRTTRIINGSPVDAATFSSRFSFTVALLQRGVKDPGEGQFCGGSLIAPTLVLTAAHCVTEFDYENGEESIAPIASIDVLANQRRLSDTTGQRIHVVGIIPDKRYTEMFDGTTTYDVALIRLASAPTGVTPIPIVHPGVDDALWGGGAGKAVDTVGNAGPWVAGWGDTNPSTDSYDESDGAAGIPVYANTLHAAKVPIISDDACENGGGSDGLGLGISFRAATQLCAGILDTSPVADHGTTNNAVDSCYGDSGGPLMVGDGGTGYKLAGVVSFGEGCASRKFHGVYARVAQLASFIDSNPVLPVRNVKPPTVKGVPIFGQTLSCSRGTWTGGGTISYRYQWVKFAVPTFLAQQGFDVSELSLADFFSPIKGATHTTYHLARRDRHRLIACEVTATNPSWTSHIYSNTVGPVTRVLQHHGGGGIEIAVPGSGDASDDSSDEGRR